MSFGVGPYDPCPCGSGMKFVPIVPVSARAEVEVFAFAPDISALAPLAQLLDPSQFQRFRHPSASPRLRRRSRSLETRGEGVGQGITGPGLTPKIKLSGLVAGRG